MQLCSRRSYEIPPPVYSPCMIVSGVSTGDQLELILSYFKQGYSNLEMLEILQPHGITISISTLKRRLRTLGLSRRPANMQLDELKRIIERELGRSGCFVHYRRKLARLRRKGYAVKRITAMKLFWERNSEGVESRKRKRLRRKIYHAKGPTLPGRLMAMTKWNFMDSACMEPSMDFQGG